MRYESAPDTLFRELRSGAVALNLKTGQYYSLNEVGTRMWVLLQQEDALDAVVETIVAEYEVEAEVAAQDVARLLEELLDSGLIRKQ
ncbi:MAG: PqqD family peptide modification chaperone [Chloroflexi bacterium]|jgi:hypothetical protein|nr:PqqD family peptide modification chaperone [Chloroflexota bacterium]